MASYDLKRSLEEVGKSLQRRYPGIQFWVDRDVTSPVCYLKVRDMETDKGYTYSHDEIDYLRFGSGEEGAFSYVYEKLARKIEDDKREHTFKVTRVTLPPISYRDVMQLPVEPEPIKEVPPVAKTLSKEVISGITNYGKY